MTRAITTRSVLRPKNTCNALIAVPAPSCPTLERHTPNAKCGATWLKCSSGHEHLRLNAVRTIHAPAVGFPRPARTAVALETHPARHLAAPAQ